jgi:Lrp/AsnC family leucine-responsive transcriptional regulator
MSAIPDIDGTDSEIVDLLVRDGRATLAEIGKAVGLTAPAVKRRLERLEAAGVITGYGAHVDQAKLGRPIEAFTELRFAGKTKVDDIAGVGTKTLIVLGTATGSGPPRE